MDRQLRQFKVALFVISGLFAVSMGMNGYTVWHLMHLKAVVAPKIESNGLTADSSLPGDTGPQEPEDVAENICSEPALLSLASEKSFSHGTTKQQMFLLQNWTEDNMPDMFNSWSLQDQKQFIKHLDLVLNELLAEKEF